MSDWDQRLRRKEFKREREQRYLEKRSEHDEVLEEVFDRRTLLTIYDLMNTHQMREMGGVISAGKESRVYYALGGDGAELAVKIYLITSAEFKRNRLQYVVGDPRFKRIPTDFRRFTYIWARREYANLEEAHRHGIPVPKPKFYRENILGMAFLGENGLRYPSLEETKLEPNDYEELSHAVMEIVGRLYRDVGMVHGDLSQFNILIGPDLKPYIIDMAQAVLKTHPSAEQFLEHAISVLVDFFRKRGVTDLDEDGILAGIRGG